MTHKKINRIIALAVFLTSLLVYGLTLAPTVVFWDVGEFIAAAKMLQVPHPPGSPLFLLVTRAAMMVPLASDMAVRAHAFSAFLSASAIFFFYLVIVKVLLILRGQPDTLLEKVGHYGAAIIGSLSLAFGSTYWGNSIEAEVYGASMFFLTSALWLAMRWRERAESEGSEKYLLLIAYLLGLSLGVHLLALLAIWPVMMIIYFKRYDFTVKSFLILMVIVIPVSFFVVYPGIVKYLPSMMDGDFQGKKSVLFKWLPWIVIAAVSYGVYTSYMAKKKLLHVALLSILLIFIGYTTYTSVLIRSNENPPMNENDPSNLARLVSYLSREQYGDAPMWPRRFSQEPHQQQQYTTYTGEWDFLVRYQLNHMFFRYLGWNYIGSEGDTQDSGVSWSRTLGIPFLIGLFGLYHLFKKNWQLGLIFLVMFLMMGPVLALYQNQQEPQPRERDYFYVGAFYVFSLWIAVGVSGLLDLVREKVKAPGAMTTASYAVVAFFAIAVPARMLQVNWNSLDRTGNYVAWDYSYNILQTCEKDAILFTNGDNDTFPLWYLQDVEGIRRDVRIVNLSLVNTPWYIKQMKDRSYYADALPVPISLSEQRIAGIQPIQWTPRNVEIPVPAEVAAKFGTTDTSILNQGKLAWYMPNTMQVGSIKAIRVQDIMVLDIIRTNQWKRPVYFAVTCAPDSRIGLDDYLWFHGLAFRLEPRKVSQTSFGLDVKVLEANLLNQPKSFSTGPQYGYRYRGIADPGVYYDENTTRLMLNYRTAFVRLALYYSSVQNDNVRAVAVLDTMESLIPRSKIPLGWELASDLASFYYRAGKTEQFESLAAEIEKTCTTMIEAGQANLNSYWNPYRVLLDLYEMKRDYAKALDVMKSLQVILPNDPSVNQRITMLEAQLAAQNAANTDTASQSKTPR